MSADMLSWHRNVVCMLVLLGCLCTQPRAMAAVNQTAVSQTYDNVHLTEAARKAKDGDSNLEDLLHWAIENSDPDQLKQQAEHVGKEQADLSDRQKEVQQVCSEIFIRVSLTCAYAEEQCGIP